ncbi:MAG TPA: DUF554 family protein, partial [Streptosporangiaceae bacterium]
MRGLGTLLNVATVLAGSSIGVLIGDRLPLRTRDVVTDGVGLVALMVAVLDGASVLDPSLRQAVGSSAPVLIVLGAILLGGIAGSALRIEDRLNGAGAVLQRRLTRSGRAGRAAPVRDVVPEGGLAEGLVEGTVEGAVEGAVGGTVDGGGGWTVDGVGDSGDAATGPASAARGGRAAGRGLAERERYIEGFVTASLVFCVGPLTI